MNRLSGAEKGILILALIFIIAGADMIASPTEMNIFHQTYRFRSARSYTEHVSAKESQIYGVVSVLFGVGIVSLVVYGRRK